MLEDVELVTPIFHTAYQFKRCRRYAARPPRCHRHLAFISAVARLNTSGYCGSTKPCGIRRLPWHQHKGVFCAGTAMAILWRAAPDINLILRIADRARLHCPTNSAGRGARKRTQLPVPRHGRAAFFPLRRLVDANDIDRPAPLIAIADTAVFAATNAALLRNTSIANFFDLLRHFAAAAAASRLLPVDLNADRACGDRQYLRLPGADDGTFSRRPRPGAAWLRSNAVLILQFQYVVFLNRRH